MLRPQRIDDQQCIECGDVTIAIGVKVDCYRCGVVAWGIVVIASSSSQSIRVDGLSSTIAKVEVIADY